MSKKKLLFDGILIFALLAVSLAAFLIIRGTSKPGKAIKVTQNREEIAEYSLADDGEYILSGGENILVIEAGEAYMKRASCPDKVCVNSGRISSVGERIVCLPNRITIEVVGEADEIFSQ